MPHLARGYERHAGSGRWVGENQHCVALVRECAGLPHTAHWRRGDPVQGSASPAGTVIATFANNGRYANATSGDSHACILLAEHDDGSLTVCDQWVGQPVAQRIIRDRAGRGDACNDASRFFLVELEP